ncbi:T9SS type A sorting domain-containing protein [Marixanthomonas sp. SCSIO 43207]|uniref:T9SS type A sorting domain-containing protein n=1 Tax=Marixanthomonas sp. SCSIO 43207 TaxID=2779360 RepID=UPI001CA82BD8|nr:T9SS type A sorting domain-containing protein [Marixanthomonas sp. SCSIO 43207]UAB82392.1 T9SS type A sorting domain-containing protein [Marixanthomonas sp. SCSIO 43207]
MKTKLLFLVFLGFLTANAQNTYNLDWRMGIGSNVELTIDQGDTVVWTWGDSAPHTVENETGNSVETFNSGVISGMGETYSYTFTEVGDNAYFCGVHGAATMSGVITVREALDIKENSLNSISIYPNPVKTSINLIIPENVDSGYIKIYDILGKQVFSKKFKSNTNVSINIANWSSGSYFLKVVSGENSLTEKFVKN